MDNIANSVIKAFEKDPNLNVITLKRGGYTLVLVYDIVHDVLYSLMSSRRFEELLDRKDRSHVHYLDALVNFNDKYDRYQLVIVDDSFCEQNVERINQIKENVIIQLNKTEPGKYITVSFGMDNFRLISVEAILTSEYLEVVDREDWSEYIEVDYNDISYDDSEANDDNDELHISLKPNIERNDDLSEQDITHKIDKRENKV